MIKNLALLLFFGLSFLNLSAQTLVKFDKSTLKVSEPYQDGNTKTETFKIGLNLVNPDKKVKYKADPIQISPASTYKKGNYTLVTTKIDELKEENIIEISVTTDSFSDNDGTIIISVNYEDENDTQHIKLQVQDTLVVKNTFPFKAILPKEYTKWHDGKRAEIFIGTNFDFYGKNTTTDWYGGVSVFLPGITDLKFHKEKSKETPKWGINAGLYHSKSFSNFGNQVSSDQEIINRTVTRRFIDTINNVPVPSINYRQDTIKISTTTELNNWGVYGGIMYQFSRFEASDENFVTNIFLGGHAEVIRRSAISTFTFDTLGTGFRTTTAQNLGFRNTLPTTEIRTYYDSYFGLNMPIQFLWKDILDFKLTPCVGFGSASFRSSASTPTPAFYLINFDLLARLGGLKLNLGGEIRGYFPNNSPIITAYLGTSFSIEKLADFIAK